MKTLMKVGMIGVLAGLIAIPAFAFVEGAGVSAEGKTLADFQREYAGTKPMIAWHKYQDYKLFGEVPQPTLGEKAIRVAPEERNLEDFMRGTKPVAGWLAQEEAERRAKLRQGEAIIYLGLPNLTSGTKPVVQMLKG